MRTISAVLFTPSLRAAFAMFFNRLHADLKFLSDALVGKSIDHCAAEALGVKGVGSAALLRHVVTSMIGTQLLRKSVLKMSLMSLMVQLTGSSLRLQFSSVCRMLRLSNFAEPESVF